MVEKSQNDKTETVNITLTVEEVDQLRTTCISMGMQLDKEKHVAPETKEFWYNLQDKLMMAKIRQVDNRTQEEKDYDFDRYLER